MEFKVAHTTVMVHISKYINRITVEFKDYGGFIEFFREQYINRITVEFKGITVEAEKITQQDINRITVEFKGWK